MWSEIQQVHDTGERSRVCRECFLLSAMLATAGAYDLGSEEDKSLFLEMPPPEYPVNASARLIGGTGRFLLTFDKATGKVTKVSVKQSTGYKILDDAAVRGLARWKVKPHTLGSYEISFTFHIGDKPDHKVWRRFEEACRYATYAPVPRAPRSAYHTYARMGSGWYRLSIDSQTGGVTDVTVIQTTRSAMLDDAALKTLRQWRFQPHTVTSVVVPAFF